MALTLACYLFFYFENATCFFFFVLFLLALPQEKLLGGIHGLDGGLIHKALRDPTKAAHKQALLKLMSQALGLSGVAGNQRNDQQGLKEVEVCRLIQCPQGNIVCVRILSIYLNSYPG